MPCNYYHRAWAAPYRSRLPVERVVLGELPMRYVILVLFVLAALGMFTLSYCYIGLSALEAGIVPMCTIGFAIVLATEPDDHGG